MANNVISMDHQSIDALFKGKLGGAINQSLLDALYDFLPQISAYKEEDKIFNFRIAIGNDFRKPGNLCESSFYKIKKYVLQNNQYDKSEIKKILKETAIFCAKNADLYVNLLGNEIEFGVFFAELEQTGVLDRELLNSNAIIIEGFSNEGIRVLSRNGSSIETSFIRMSFAEPFEGDKYESVTTHWSSECQYWDGIFRKVSQNVHGTMCLIVRPRWTNDDDNFIGGKAADFEGISIAYERTNDSKKTIALQNGVELFISMLDFDGVTVLDTAGRVRSYHNIVDNTRNPISVPGGARHKAYASLRNDSQWESKAYVGIYFQSHEGEVKYYDFATHQECDYFKSEVMNYGSDDPHFRGVIKYYYEGRYDDVWNSYYQFFQSQYPLYCDIELLETAHLGWDNFSNEIQPAQKLCADLIASGLFNIVISSPGAARKLINVLIMCYVGNQYGVSEGAEQDVETILGAIDKNTWDAYFENRDYIYSKLLRELSSGSSSQKTHWEKLTNLIKKSGCTIPEDFTLESFYWRYRAYNRIDDIKHGYEQGEIPDKTKLIEY